MPRSPLEHLPLADLGASPQSVPAQLRSPPESAEHEPAPRPGPGWTWPRWGGRVSAPSGRASGYGCGGRVATGLCPSGELGGCRDGEGSQLGRVKFTEAALEPEWVHWSHNKDWEG